MMLTGAGLRSRRDLSRHQRPRVRVQLGRRVRHARSSPAAGYMGTPLWGARCCSSSRRPRGRRGSRCSCSRALLDRHGATRRRLDADGTRSGRGRSAAMGAAFALCALVLPRAAARVVVAHFIAAQSCVNALLDIRVLLRPSQVVDGKVAGASDAHNMALVDVRHDRRRGPCGRGPSSGSRGRSPCSTSRCGSVDRGRCARSAVRSAHGFASR